MAQEIKLATAAAVHEWAGFGCYPVTLTDWQTDDCPLEHPVFDQYNRHAWFKPKAIIANAAMARAWSSGLAPVKWRQ